MTQSLYLHHAGITNQSPLLPSPTQSLGTKLLSTEDFARETTSMPLLSHVLPKADSETHPGM